MGVGAMTKREVLIAIVEQPGWQPPDSSAVQLAVQELAQAGWVLTRQRGGWEATPKAIDAYPTFYDDPELRDPACKLGPTPLEAEHGSIARSDREPTVPARRVEYLLVGLLRALPLIQVYELVAQVQAAYPSDGPEWEIARQLVARMTER